MRPAEAAHGLARARSILPALCAGVLALVLAGCSTAGPQPISRNELAEAQTFPYFRLYWVGPTFEGHRLAATDGLRSYISTYGDSVYYGDCVQSKGIFGGGSCRLPLQVTTVIFHMHSNGPLGPQTNLVVRGVPAVQYDGGRSVEVYTGQTAVDIFSDTAAHALAAAQLLRPVNAPGSSTGDLPLPVFCPGLSGPVSPELQSIMLHLPRRACQTSAAYLAFAKSIKG